MIPTPSSRRARGLTSRLHAFVLCGLGSAATLPAATQTLIADAIPYASWNGSVPQMDDAWTGNTGNAPVLVAEPAPSASRYFTLANGVVHRNLPATATENFALVIDALHGDYQRGLWAGVFNAAGTEGYGFVWDSSTSPGQGYVSIRKFTVAAPSSLVFNSYGTMLGSSIASGRSPVAGARAQLKLTWNGATSTLNLYVDGVLKRTVVDSSYASFSRLFVSGNGTGALPAQFDNVSVTLNDATPPAVALTAPSGGVTVSGSTVALTATASDNIGLAGVQFVLNNTQNLGAEDTVAPYTVDWDTLPLENGVCQLTAVARDLAGNTTISAPVPVFVSNPSTAGAVLSWTTYEAEAATLHAGATLQTGGTWGQSGNEAAFEARGKQCVVLDAIGEYVEWTNVVAANRLTVRYALPAETDTATLALYVNGVFATDLALTGARTRETKPTANVPGGVVRFWDEVLVTANIPNNATLRLQCDTLTVACQVDFAELETAPAALTAPDGTWVAVDGFDRAAIVAALTTANLPGGSKKVWLPPGTYTIEMVGTNPWTPIAIPAGIELRGAGIWHTTIVKNWGGANARLFRIAGAGNTVQDLKIVDTITTLSGNSSNCAFDVIGSTNCVLQDIWTEYASLAIAYAANTLTVRDCRVRNGYKDAVHLATTAHDGLIENCSFRNTGDDCAAFVIYGATALHHNTARYNTMEGTYWGRSVSLQGGDSTLAEYNLVRDSSMAGVMIAIDSWGANTWDHNTNFLVRRNVIIRCGNQISAAAGAAIAFYTPSTVLRPMSGSVEENTVLAPPFHGSRLNGNVGDATHLVYFQDNGIEAPTTAGGPPWVRKQLNLLPGSNCVHTPNTDL